TVENAEAGRRVKKSNLDDIAEGLGGGPGDLLSPEGEFHARFRDEYAYDNFEQCVSFIGEWLKRQPPAHSSGQRPLDELLSCLHRAANHTVAYTARVRRHGEPRDLDRELGLSDEWLRVAELILKIEDLREVRPLARRLFEKARYWADIDCWTDQQI